MAAGLVVVALAAVLAWRWRAAATARPELADDMTSIAAVPVVPAPAVPVAAESAPVSVPAKPVAPAPVVPPVPRAAVPAPAVPAPSPAATLPAVKPAASEPAATPILAPILAPAPAPVKPTPAGDARVASPSKAPALAPPLDAFSPAERAVLDAVEKRQFDAVISDPALAGQMAKLFVAARRLKEPFDLLGVPANRARIPQYQGLVATDLWNEVEHVEGPFGVALRQRVWLVIRDRLVQDIKKQLLSGKILQQSISSQASIRRVYLYILTKVDYSTGGQVRACEPADSLRQAVEAFFNDNYFSNDLLAPAPRERDQAWEKQIPWLARLFAARRR